MVSASCPLFMLVPGDIGGLGVYILNDSDQAFRRCWISEAFPDRLYKKSLRNKETLPRECFPSGNNPLFSYI